MNRRKYNLELVKIETYQGQFEIALENRFSVLSSETKQNKTYIPKMGDLKKSRKTRLQAYASKRRTNYQARLAQKQKSSWLSFTRQKTSTNNTGININFQIVLKRPANRGCTRLYIPRLNGN